MRSIYSGFSIDTLSFAPRTTLEKAINSLAERGCTALQLSLHPGFLWPSELDSQARSTIRAHIERSGMRITCVNLPGVEVNVGSPAEEVRHYSRDLLKQNIRLAGELGAPFIVMAAGRQHPLVPSPREALMGRLREALDELVPFAEREGAAVCIENAPSAFLPDTASLIQATSAMGHAGVGFCYDLPNGHFIKEDVGSALSSLGDRLKLVHVADTGQDAPSHARVGLGTIDFRHVHSVLKDIGYRALPVLEVISVDGLDAIHQSLQALDHFGWQASTAAIGTEMAAP